MLDARLVVAVLGLLPFLGILWHAVRRTVVRERDLVWGGLAGLVAFLGLGHAMAILLETHPVLSGTAGEALALALLVLSVAGGLAAGLWILQRTPTARISRLAWIAWASVAYLAIHSTADGFLFGGALVPRPPGVPEGIPVDGLAIAATVAHRAAEGSLVVLPALFASWRPAKAVGLLSVGLLTIPAAFLSAQLLAVSALVPYLVLLSAFAGLEAGLAVGLVFGAFVPQASEVPRARWVVAAAAVFLLVLLLHGIVE